MLKSIYAVIMILTSSLGKELPCQERMISFLVAIYFVQMEGATFNHLS